jgi:hypothetical protein
MIGAPESASVRQQAIISVPPLATLNKTSQPPFKNVCLKADGTLIRMGP